MTKKIRYSLIAIGFVFFLTAAPLMVLYVRGLTYNFATNKFVKTGILAVRVTPANASIFLDGKIKRQSQGDIKFLVPDAYQVDIKNPGYNDWGKRLNVDAGQVAWANPAFGNIYLFLQNPPAQSLALGVLDFYSQGKNLFYLTSESAVVIASDNFSSQQVYPLPKNVSIILTQDSTGQNFILTNQAASSSTPLFLVFNKSSGKFTDISSLLLGTAKLQFGSGGDLFALNNNILYSINLENKTKAAIFSGVKTFYFQGDQLYYVKQTGENYELDVSLAPFSQSQLLVAGLPDFNSGSLFVTFGKEIFLIGDGRVYLLSSSMRQVSDNISAFNFDPNNSFLSLIHSGEFDYYDPVAASLNFITRSSEALSNPQVLTAIGNAFFLQGNKLMVIELDARDSQNQYQLYQGTNIQKFIVDDAGKNILLLDNGQLKNLVIR